MSWPGWVGGGLCQELPGSAAANRVAPLFPPSLLLTSAPSPLTPSLPLSQTDGSGLLTAAAADPATSLLAGAGAGVAARQPLLPLSLNLGHQSYHHAAPASVTSCLAGLGL